VTLVMASLDGKCHETERRGTSAFTRQACLRPGPCEQQLRSAAVTCRERHIEAPENAAARPSETGTDRSHDRRDAQESRERCVSGRKQRRGLPATVGALQGGERRQRVHEIAKPVGQVDK
jgi:hypothetical protein